MKKGFTLVELLAVLIILAIIMVITVPIFLGAVSNAKQLSFLRGSEFILNAAEFEYAENIGTIGSEYTVVYEDGILVGVNSLDIDGKTPDYAIVTINQTGQIKMAIWNNELNSCITKSYEEEKPVLQESILVKEDCLASIGGAIVVSYPQVTDTNPGIICSTTLVEDYANNSICNINSIEDLVAFSNLAKTNNFLSKTINIGSNLDFSNNKSYINPTSLVFGDINGNSIIESIKTELTTGAGFYPIGTSLVFRGIFNGNTKTIKNLHIDRNIDNIALFGNSYMAVIKNFTLDNSYVKGNNYVGSVAGNAGFSTFITGVISSNVEIVGNNYIGGLVGYIPGQASVNTTITSGKVNGNSYVGGVAGYLYGSTSYYAILGNSIFSGDVVGNSYVGGVLGTKTSSWATFSSVVMTSGTVTATTNYGRIIGVNGPASALANKEILVNGSLVVGTSVTSVDGKDTDESYFYDINLYETFGMDTYIGGDALSDGSYFDYDLASNITVSYIPTSITMSGTGVLGDPYLIYDYDDLKESSLSQSAHYKLMSDIDLSGKPFYVLASSSHQFIGKFDGNGKTISNINIKGANNVGIFGRIQNGTVEDLNINAANVYGLNNVGTIVGYLSGGGMATGININNANVTGENYVGGLAGYSVGNSTITLNRVSGNVTGLNYVGGLDGYIEGYVSAYAYLTYSVFSGNVTGNSYVGGVLGSKTSSWGWFSDVAMFSGSVTATSNYGRVIGAETSWSAIANSNVLVNGQTVTSALMTSIDGQDKTPSELLNQSTYISIGLNFTNTVSGTYVWRIEDNNILIDRN